MQRVITQSDATRMLKAAKAAGYANAKIECRHPDGVISLIASDDEFSTPEKNAVSYTHLTLPTILLV